VLIAVRSDVKSSEQRRCFQRVFQQEIQAQIISLTDMEASRRTMRERVDSYLHGEPCVHDDATAGRLITPINGGAQCME
jgi:hypothetical protein